MKIEIFDIDNNCLYEGRYDGFWSKYIFDANNNRIYEENSNGSWWRYKFNNDGKKIYMLNYTGHNFVWKKEQNNERYVNKFFINFNLPEISLII